MHQAALLLLTFVAGFAGVALESVGFRLLAPHFGTAISVSTIVVGVVLVGLAIGYAVGGRLVDRRPERAVLERLIVGSAVWILAIIPLHRGLLDAAAGLSEIAGILTGATLVFVPPTIALAMVCPFVIRLLGSNAAAGEAAGKVYAISTVGSLAGVFVTTFLLLPVLGVRLSLALPVAGLLACTALVRVADGSHAKVS